MDIKKRRENERKFLNWNEDENGFRVYFFDVLGHNGWKARYVKEVDVNEKL